MKQVGPKTFRDFEPAPACCPNCGKELDAATSVEPGSDVRAPEEGDFSICNRCAHIAVFADERLLREPTTEEMEAFKLLPEWPTVVRAQELIRATQAIIRKDRR